MTCGDVDLRGRGLAGTDLLYPSPCSCQQKNMGTDTKGPSPCPPIYTGQGLKNGDEVEISDLRAEVVMRVTGESKGGTVTLSPKK